MRKMFVNLLVIFAVLFLLSDKANAEISKTVACMELAETGISGFRLKEAGLPYPKLVIDDVIASMLWHKAVAIGYYKSKSVEEAAEKAFKYCVESPLWPE